MSDRPDPKASLKALMAIVLDMVRADPQRRPSAEIQRWHRELSTAVGVAPSHARTNRELLDAVLRLELVMRERDASTSGSPVDASGEPGGSGSDRVTRR